MIAAWKAYNLGFSEPHVDPRLLEFSARALDDLRKAGMPEE